MTNIILIMTDQHRADALGCYGNDVIETPNLDYLASVGTRFAHAYTPSPSCVPARAALMTGMEPWHTGILGMGGGQGPMGVGFAHTLPGELAKAGYHAAGVGKMHFYPQRSLNGFHETVLDESGREEDPGFVSDYRAWFRQQSGGRYDIVDHGIGWNSWMARPYHAPEWMHPTNWTVNEAIRFLGRRDPSRRFFLKVSFARPHSPYDAPQPYYDRYLRQEEKLPAPYRGDWDGMHDDPAEALRPDAWRGVKRSADILHARAGYYGSITHIDHQLGRLFERLKKEKLFDSSLILFVSDHGDMLGDHHLWRKTYAYEGSARIPMIAKLPGGRPAGAPAVIHAPVVLQDLMPTMLEAAGVPVPAAVDGLSLGSALRGDISGLETRGYIHGEHSTCYSEEQEMQYLTDGVFKYIWFPRLGTEQLFSLRDDLSESEDLAAEPKWREELLRWRGRLVRKLEARDVGLTDGDELVCQAGKPYLTSPYYEERRKRAAFDWESWTRKGAGSPVQEG